MVKAYYKYEQSNSFGCVLPTIVPRPILVTAKGRQYVMAAAHEAVNLVCLKTKSVIQTLVRPSTDDLAVVSAMTYSEETKRAFVGYSNGNIAVFDMTNGEVVSRFSFGEKAISGTYFVQSELSLFLIVESQDSSLSVFDLQMEEPVFRIREQRAPIVKSLMYNLFTKMATISKDGIVRLYNFSNCVLEHSIETGKSDLSDAAVISTSKGECLVIGCSDDDLLLVDLSNNRLSAFKRQSFHKIVQIELIDSLLVTLSDNQSIEVYSVLDVRQMTLKHKRKAKRNVKDLPSLEDYLEALPNCLSLEAEVKLSENSKRMALVDQSNLERLSLIAFTGKNSYKTVEIDISGQKIVRETITACFGHSQPVLFSAVSTDDFHLVSGSSDSVCLWQLQTCDLVKRFDIRNASCALFLPSNRYLAIASLNGEMTLIDLNSHEAVSSFSLGNQIADFALKSTSERLELCVLTTGASLHSMSFNLNEGSVTMKQTSTVKLADEPTRIKFSNSGKHCFVAFLNNSIRMYHSDTFRETVAFYGHSLPVSDFDVSTDDYVLASVSLDKSIRVWDKDFGNCRRIINKAHENGGLRLKIVKDTHYAITTGKDGLVKQWDLDTFELVSVIESVFGLEVRVLSLSKEGDFFVAGGSGGVLRRFNQGKEQVFAVEAKEKLEEENYVHEDIKQGEKDLSKASVLKRYEMIKSAEDLMEFIDEVERDQGETQRAYEFDEAALKRRDRPSFDKSQETDNLNPAELVLKRLDKVPKSELSDLFDYVHFRYFESLLKYANYAIKNSVYENISFALLQAIVEKNQLNLLQNRSLMSVFERVLRRSTASLHDSLKTATFNVSALRIGLKETRTIGFKDFN